jgi:hypothetical protein
MNESSARADRHPSLSRILTTLNGSSTARQARLIQEHLKLCASCRRFAGESDRFLTELSSYSQTRPRRTAASKIFWDGVAWFPRPRWVSALAIGTAFFLAASLPDGVPQVQASELLVRAETAQEARKGRVLLADPLYRIKMEGNKTACQISGSRWQPVTGRSHNACDSLRQSLIGADWNSEDPLSVRTYRKWHNSLTKRRDSLIRGEIYSVVRTESSQGPIAAATLRVFSSDYLPVELRLEFSDSREILVEAYRFTSPEPSASVLTAATESKPVDATGAQLMNGIEVRAWQALHEVEADSGWDAAITRTAKSVVVVSSIAETGRIDRLRKLLQSEPHLELYDLRSYRFNHASLWPRRPVSGTVIPLAEKMLEDRFSEASERSQYVTGVSNISKTVVGLAFEYERLRERRNALRSCTCAAHLDPLLRDTQARLAQQLRAEAELLSEALGPLPDSTRQAGLTYLAARRLDAAVESLFVAAPGPSSEERRDAIIRTVRQLLSRPHSSR